MKVKIGKGAMSMARLASLTGGILGGCGEQSFEFVCTDSREADGKTLFVAIRGERVDGHSYIAKAAELGCRCVLSEREIEGCAGLSFVKVKDSVAALSTLARGYGEGDKRKTVAITGSVGKTTTKETVAAALSSLAPYKTQGNYNSVIGSPLSILEMDENTAAAVLEMGMSGLHEIESMSRAARPDVAIITNIGSSHLEMLGSRENIRRAKLEITCGLKEDGVLLINGDDPMLRDCDCGVKTMRVGLADENHDFYAKDIENGDGCVSFTAVYPDRTEQRVTLQAVGDHVVQSALFGCAAAYLLGVDKEAAAEGLSRFENTGMRQNIYPLGQITVVEDCYNASPESMRAAIRVATGLAERRGGRAVALLGDMKELGESSAELHRGVGRFAAEQGIRLLISYGTLAKEIAAGAAEVGGCEVFTLDADPVAAADLIAEKIENNDILLFKASRAMALENVIKILKERTV